MVKGMLMIKPAAEFYLGPLPAQDGTGLKCLISTGVTYVTVKSFDRCVHQIFVRSIKKAHWEILEKKFELIIWIFTILME